MALKLSCDNVTLLPRVKPEAVGRRVTLCQLIKVGLDKLTKSEIYHVGQLFDHTMNWDDSFLLIALGFASTTSHRKYLIYEAQVVFGRRM